MNTETPPQIEVPDISSEAFEGFIGAIANALNDWLTPTPETKMGFALFVMGQNGEMRYVSNAPREATMPMMKSFIDINSVDIAKAKRARNKESRKKIKAVK